MYNLKEVPVGGTAKVVIEAEGTQPVTVTFTVG